MSERLRVAVVGTGQFGRNHIRVIEESPEAVLAAVVDPDSERTRSHPAIALREIKDLPPGIDAAILAAPTGVHAEVGCEILERGIDLLVEKPIAPNLPATDRIIETANRNGRVLQVGHLERFNPAVAALEEAVTTPLFFEIHRLSLFSPRSLDVDVVLDLMIHDLDIVLSLARSPLEEVRAAGVSILSPKVDIANVRLQFADGCVANLTASRVSTERVRKLRLFQPSQYISLDYAKQDAVVFTVGPGQQISFRQLAVAKEEPLKRQFSSFCESVRSRQEPKLSGRRVRRTLEVALNIIDKMEQHAEVVARGLASASASFPCRP